MRSLFLASLVLAMGCSQVLEDDEAGSDALTGRVQPNEDIPTLIENGGVELLSAYNGLLDKVSPPCVTGTMSGVNAGAVAQHSTLAVVETREELKKEIGIDANLSIKAPTASAKAAIDILNSFQQSSSSVTVVFKIAASYRLDAVTPQVTLTDDAKAALADSGDPNDEDDNPDAFIAKCGSGFISGVRLEARALLVMQLTTASTEQADSVKVDVGGEVNTPLTGTTAELGTKLSSVVKKNSATTSSQLLLTGFTSDTTLADKDVDATVESLRALEKDLTGAVRAAHDADAGGGKHPRSVVPVSFGVRGYLDATNAPKRELRVVQDKLVKAEAWFEDNARFRNVLDDVYYGEILPYLHAARNDDGSDDFTRRAGFGLLLPDGSKVKRPMQVAELDAIAGQWKKQFDPEARVATTARRELDAAIEGCLDQEMMQQRYPKSCLDIEQEPAFGLALAAMKDYEKGGRILPLRHRFSHGTGATLIAPDKAFSGDAAGLCRAIGGGWRQATFADLAAAAPALTAHDPPNAWIGDPQNAGCGANQEAWLANPNGNSAELSKSVVCQDPSMISNVITSSTQPILCVGGDGPFGKVEPLDLHYTPYIRAR